MHVSRVEILKKRGGRIMKKNVSKVTVALILAVALLMSMPTEAKAWYTCNVNHKTMAKDICSCGYERVHVTSPSITFYVMNTNTAVLRAEPRNTGKKINTNYCLPQRISINGRIRNESNNLWLRNGSNWIFADRVAFDFDTYAKAANKNTSGLISMYNNFKTGGKYDIKQDYGLGCNTYKYYVYVKGKVQSRRYTGEELGNIIYGYVCAKKGLSLTEAIGATCATGNCWDLNDNVNITRGYTYGYIGVWAN